MLKPCTRSLTDKTGLTGFLKESRRFLARSGRPEPAASCSQRGHDADDCDPMCNLYAPSCSERGFRAFSPGAMSVGTGPR